MSSAPPVSPDAIRVVIVDDDPAVCSGLKVALEYVSGGDIHVVGTANDGHQAIDAVSAHHPDVVLMDIQMPRLDGISATRKIRSAPNPPRVIIITTFDANDEVIRAAEADASGFMLKVEDPADMVEGIKSVASGQGVLSPRSAKQVLSYLADEINAPAKRAAESAVNQLTEREKDVACLAAHGLSNSEIAAELYLGESTVKSHLMSAQQKLGARNRVMVAVAVTRAGLID